MANDWTQVIPQLLAQGLLALREQVRMPMLVNRGYESMAGAKGSTIDIPIPSAITAVAVTPSNTAPASTDSTPTSVSLVMDQWFEAPFHLTDREMMEAMSGTIPMQASEAVKAIANTVDVSIMGNYTSVYGASGTAGTVPFDDTTTNDGNQLRRILNTQLAPMDPRYVVMDPESEASALELRAFQDVSWNGSTAGILESQINRKLGFGWFMDQNVLSHTAGTLVGDAIHGGAVNGALAVGDVTMAIDATSLVGTIVIGDVFTFAGDTQQYVATNTTTAAANAIAAVTFNPPIKTIVDDGTILTIVDDHTVNLGFHRDAFAFASRPLESQNLPGSMVQSATDPVSGLTLRLEVTREHKQTRFSYDMLWGSACPRPELAARLLG